jgi:hypothetical protein
VFYVLGLHVFKTFGCPFAKPPHSVLVLLATVVERAVPFLFPTFALFDVKAGEVL